MGTVLDPFIWGLSVADGRMTWIPLAPDATPGVLPPIVDPSDRNVTPGVDIPTAATTGNIPGQVLKGPYGPGQSFSDVNGVPLTIPASGLLTITVPNVDLYGYDLQCALNVKAPGFRWRRGKCHPPAVWSNGLTQLSQVIYAPSSQQSNMVLEDLEIWAESPTDYTDGLKGSNFIARRLNIHHVTDTVLIFGGTSTLLEACWLHDNQHWLVDRTKNGGPSHDDGVQIQSGTGIVLRGNNIPGAVNSAIQITQDSGRIVGPLTLDRNWMGRGGYTVNIAEKGLGPIQVVATGNRFYHDSSVVSGGDTVDIGIPSTSRAISTLTGNVILATGAAAHIINA